MMTIRRHDRGRLLWCLPIASALFACSSQVQSDYPGEPIATLHGKVTANAASLESIPDVSAAIVWSQVRPEFVGERVDVQGSFPASFKLDLFEPPPAEAELKMDSDYCVGEYRSGEVGEDGECDGQLVPAGTPMGFWLGYIVAVDASTVEGKLDEPEVIGADVDHFIVYFEHDELDENDLPDDPTAEQLAQYMKLLDPDYIGSRDAGYHLGKVNPEHRAQRQERWECGWQGLCVHWAVEDPTLRFQSHSQSQADWDFERCTAHFPENPTCEAFLPGTTDDEPASSVACREQYESLGNDCGGLVSTERLLANPDDLDDPIAIQLGLSFWDAADWNTPF